LIADQVLTSDIGAIGKPVVGRSLHVAMEFVQRTVKLIGSGFVSTNTVISKPIMHRVQEEPSEKGEPAIS
jgi:hypothetical protein